MAEVLSRAAFGGGGGGHSGIMLTNYVQNYKSVLPNWLAFSAPSPCCFRTMELLCYLMWIMQRTPS